MSKVGKQSQAGKQQLSLRVNVLCAISGQSRCGLVVFGEQCLSGKNKLLRLEPKRHKSFICRQITNWEPCGKKTSLELGQDPVLGFFQITLQSSIWSQVSTCDLQNHFKKATITKNRANRITKLCVSILRSRQS